MTRKLAASNMESQSLSGFLESDVKNTYRGTLKSTACSFVWNPHTSTSPFPSPLHQYKLWVETTTAFHQDLFIIGSFTLHKLGHIIDIFLIGPLRQFKLHVNGIMAPFSHFIYQQILLLLGELGCSLSSQVFCLNYIVVSFKLRGYQILIKLFSRITNRDISLFFMGFGAFKS